MKPPFWLWSGLLTGTIFAWLVLFPVMDRIMGR